MRKLLFSLLVLASVCLVLCASADAPRVYLDRTSIQVARGGYGWIRSQLQYLPDNVHITGMRWESSNESIVSINQEAKYIAHEKGEAQLIRRITTSDGREYIGICQVRVVIPVENILPENAEMVVLAGSTVPLPEIRVLPEEADNRSCTWTSSHPETVSIDQGMLTAHAAGTVTLTATSDERMDGRRIRSCTVRVQVIPAVEYAVFQGYGGLLRLEAGFSETLRLAVRPEGIPLSALHFTSSAEDIVSVSDTGVVRGLNPGQAVIRVWTDQTRSGERLEDEIQVDVFRKIEKISLSPRTLAAFRGQTVSLTPLILPEGADTSTLSLEWTSGNPYAAELSAQDLSASVRCWQVGQSTISVRALDGSGKAASLRLCVEPEVPVTLREVTETPGTMTGLSLRFKSRMRETWIRQIRMRCTFMDAQGTALSTIENTFPYEIRPTRFVTYPLSFDSVPDHAAALSLEITGIVYDGGVYEIPENGRTALIHPLN